MKSKYKLKIKEISMRFKSSLFFLLGVLCLLALGQMVQAEPWTDPTCAAPDCNTNGPVWISPNTTQTGYVDLTGYVKTVITDDNKNYFNVPDTSTSQQPVLDIYDQRTGTIPGAASLYVRTALDGKPAIYGYSTGSAVTSYGGLFKAEAAPGLKVVGGIVISPLELNPEYNHEGLLYLNSSTNQFRYYGGGAWRILNPWLTDGNELYYSLDAGTARGVAIKNGDLTGPNDNYTLDVLRVSQSTSDRTIYGRLTIDSSWNYYASGFIGGYDDSGNAVGVRGKVSDHMGGLMKNYGGYFEAAGPANGTAGVYGLASAAGTASPTYGGYFVSAGNAGRGVYGYASGTGSITNYGGYFTADGDEGQGVYGHASATNGLNTNYGGFFTAAGGNGIGVYAAGGSSGAAIAADGVMRMKDVTAPGFNVSGYGQIYVNDDKLYFRDDNSNVYDLTGGGSGKIADGTVTGQLPYWDNTAGEWTPSTSPALIWDPSNSRLGLGMSPTATLSVNGSIYATGSSSQVAYLSPTGSGTNGLLIIGSTDANQKGIDINMTASASSYGVYADSNATNGTGVYGRGFYGVRGESIVNYGGYFTSGGTATGAAGVYGESTSLSNSTYGGHFVSSSAQGRGVYAVASGTSNGAAAVYGSATGTSGTTYGGYFTNASSSGYGVYGIATNTSNPNYGGYFESAGWGGTGVTGRSTGGGLVYGGNFAITNASVSPNSAAVYANANVGGSNAIYAGYFTTTSTGGRGVYATSPYIAGEFYTAGATGQAVRGFSAGTNDTYGGYFYNSNSSNTGSAVYAYNASPNYYAGRFVLPNTGTGYAVYAQNTSATGYAGYFEGRVRSTSKFTTNTSDSASAPGFTWSGDENMGLFRVSDDVIGFSTNGTEKMRLDASGNLSLGTSSSNGKFTVEGDIALVQMTAPSASAGYGKLYVKSTDKKIYYKDSSGNEYDLTAGSGSATGDNGTAAGQMNFWDGSKWTYTETSEMVWNDTNKNVGIGVASPTSTNRLHVVNSGTAAGSAAVYGNASATGAVTSYGGYFVSSGDTGRGVYGTSGGTGVTYGGYFTASSVSNTGAGLYAKSFATGDNSYGIYGETLSTAAAIYGNNARTTAGTGGVGVEGVSSAPAGGAGVIGRATNTGAGQVRGGEFYSAGSVGDALYASATGASGRGLYVSGLGESARFAGSEVVITDGSDAIGYATGAGDLYVGDALEVDGTSYLANVNSSAQFLAYSSDTVSAPGYSWGGDTNTGIYHSAADTINFSTAGTLRVTIGSTGQVTLAGDLQVGGVADAVDEFIYFDGTAESLSWNNTTGRFDLSDELDAANIYSSGNFYSAAGIYFDNDYSVANDYLYFGGDPTNQPSVSAGNIRFYNGAAETDNRFYFSAPIVDVDTYSTTVGATNRDLYIDNAGLMGYVSSSLRYKDNVQDMEDVSWLYALRPVNFTYKNDDGKAKQYGLIAEEVEKVNPFFVSYDEEGLPETVSYSALVTPMLEAIQTQKQQLDALETKVEMIEKDGCSNNEAILMETIEKLEARIEALEAEKAEPVKTSFWSKLW